MCVYSLSLRLSNQFQLTCLNETHSISTVTAGSALPSSNASFNSFRHIFLSVKALPSRSPQYEVSSTSFLYHFIPVRLIPKSFHILDMFLYFNSNSLCKTHSYTIVDITCH